MDEALKALGITWYGFFAYIINFAVLVLILRWALYDPVRNMLAQRKQRIADGLAAADKAREEAAQQRAEFEEELAKARQQAQEEARKAAEQTEKMRQDILDKAHQEAQEIKERAKKEAEQQKEQVASDLQKQAADLAMQIARKISAEAIDEKSQHKLIDQFLDNLGEA